MKSNASIPIIMKNPKWHNGINPCPTAATDPGCAAAKSLLVVHSARYLRRGRLGCSGFGIDK